VIVLGQRDIGELLSMRDCIEVMASALGALARGESMVPLRTMMRLPTRDGASTDIFALMPAYVGSPPAMGAKIISVFPGNHGTSFDSHQGAVLLFDASNGSLQAVMDATAITAIRTAAVSALSARLLARDDADELAILGSGVQARKHLEAIPLVRNIRRVRVWSRNRANAERLAGTVGGGNIELMICDTAETAVKGASVVCACTSSREPVLRGDWVADGAHVIAVGSATPGAREVDTALVKRSRLFVDSRVSALKEPGDILIPIEEGEITPDHIVAELGELVNGSRQGRQSREEVTFFKSLGLAVEDLAAAQHVHAQAMRQSKGTHFDLGGTRDSH
jgi:ornithine cyclodeaminase/alanine dehydrogenase-like protein (mu-crystallin family)